MAAGATYVPIATVSPSGTGTVTFSSIPSTYTDLILQGNVGTVSTGNVWTINVNGDSGSNYSATNLYGNGSAAGSGRVSNFTYWLSGTASGADTNAGSSNFIAQFMNYSNTTTYKTMINRMNSTAGGAPSTETRVNLWRSTSAINSISMVCSVNFTSGTLFTLYVIAFKLSDDTSEVKFHFLFFMSMQNQSTHGCLHYSSRSE